MSTAIIGTGNIGSRLARDLVNGGERVVLAARDEAHAAALARELGSLASSAAVSEAIADADVVVLAVWLDQIREVIAQNADALKGKVVVDPSNPLKPDGKGGMIRSLPEGQSAAAVVASLLPAEAHYVKAFGTLVPPSLGSGANRSPRRAVLFYATDDDQAAATIERLIVIAGLDPVKAGGVKDAARIEVPGGDLHEYGGLNGRLLDADEARARSAQAAPSHPRRGRP